MSFLGDLTVTGDYPAPAWRAELCAGLVVRRALLSLRKTVALVMRVGAALGALSLAAFWLLLDVLGGRSVVLT